VVLHKGQLTAKNVHPGLLVEMRLPVSVAKPLAAADPLLAGPAA
jgi:hypothetical protein